MGQPVTKPVTMQDNRAKQELVVAVTTGDKAGAGSNISAWIRLEDVAGSKSHKIHLSKVLPDDLERGFTDVFPQPDLSHFNDIHIIELGREDTLFVDRWFVDRITIKNKRKVFVFPIQRWIKQDKMYRIGRYDCCLPNYSIDPKGRREELEEKREMYAYQQIIPGGPVQLNELPDDEKFHESYVDNIFRKGLKLVAGSHFTSSTTDRITNLSCYQELFQLNDSLSEPNSVKHWKTDKWFGLQRVQGINPNLITLCKEIPYKLAVSSEMVKPILRMGLEEAMDENRLFIVDLKIMEGISHVPNRPLVAPICLLYKNHQDELMPLAIQLQQDKGPDNPVFLPTDSIHTWTLAKLWFNMAEAQYHQCVTHLALCRLLIESICICTHRTLSPSHPIFRLLAPHFLYHLASEENLNKELIDPGTWIEKISSIGNRGMHELIARVYNEFDFGSDGHIHKDMTARGVMEKSVLPHYPYRDDSIAIFDIIQDYVSVIVMHYYDTERKLAEDDEVHTWRKELSADKNSLQGAGLKGVPGCDKAGFSTRQQTRRTEDDVFRLLPDTDVILHLMAVTKVLGLPGTSMLGDFDIAYLYEDVCVKARRRLKNRLRSLGESIKSRNANLKHPYSYLDPTEFVPNSITS